MPIFVDSGPIPIIFGIWGFLDPGILALGFWGFRVRGLDFKSNYEPGQPSGGAKFSKMAPPGFQKQGGSRFSKKKKSSTAYLEV